MPMFSSISPWWKLNNMGRGRTKFNKRNNNKKNPLDQTVVALIKFFAENKSQLDINLRSYLSKKLFSKKLYFLRKWTTIGISFVGNDYRRNLLHVLYPVYLEIKSEESICSINFINL
jgi:hypothetical protein